MVNKYDVVVIGAGNGGLMAALRASKMGLKTLTFREKDIRKFVCQVFNGNNYVKLFY